MNATSDYASLIEAACKQVDTNEHHACRTTPDCRASMRSGCAKCGVAVMKGSIGVSRIVVGRRGVVKLMTDHDECVVTFMGVEVVYE